MSKIKANEISNLAGDAPPAITGGYTYVTTLYYTTPGTHQFVKANYPWLRAIRIKAQAAGGPGGGLASDPGGRGGGGGGGYAERFYTDIEALDSSVPVTVPGPTVGTTGTGPTGGAAAFGDSGDPWCTRATGGQAGTESIGGSGGHGSHGDLLLGGSGGANGSRDTTTTPASRQWGGAGGSSQLGGGANARGPLGAVVDGFSGREYGGGGGGAAAHITHSGALGGNGAQGIVIIELYA